MCVPRYLGVCHLMGTIESTNAAGANRKGDACLQKQKRLEFLLLPKFKYKQV